MIEALLEATRDRLREVLQLQPHDCDIMPGGAPPAMAGDLYYAVDEVSVQSGDRASLKETYSVGVWITLRAGVLPDDRMNNAYLSQSRFLTGAERRVLAAIHGKHELRAAANAILTRDKLIGSGEFQWPLYYTGRGRTERKTGWILGDDEENPVPCMVRMLPFTGGLRLQNIENFT